MEIEKSLDVNNLERKTSPTYQQIYANTAGMAANFYDVTLVFSRVLPTIGKEPILEDQASVTVPWELLKVLGKVIQQAINPCPQTVQCMELS